MGKTKFYFVAETSVSKLISRKCLRRILSINQGGAGGNDGTASPCLCDDDNTFYISHEKAITQSNLAELFIFTSRILLGFNKSCFRLKKRNKKARIYEYL